MRTSRTRISARAAARSSPGRQDTGERFMIPPTGPERSRPRSSPRRTSPSLMVPSRRPWSSTTTTSLSEALSSRFTASVMDAVSRTRLSASSGMVAISSAVARL